MPVELHAVNADGSTGALLETRRTDQRGRVDFPVAAGSYDLVVPEAPDWAATTLKTLGLAAEEAGATQVGEFGQVQLAKLDVRAFNDGNGTRVHEAGEPSMEGWNVTLSGEGKTVTTPMGTEAASFDGLLPGSYTITVAPGAGFLSTTHTSLPLSIRSRRTLSSPGPRRSASGTASRPASRPGSSTTATATAGRTRVSAA